MDMGKPKGATKKGKAVRVDVAHHLLREGAKVYEVIEFLLKSFAISEKTAKRDIEEAQALKKALGSSDLSEEVGAILGCLDILYKESRQLKEKDISLSLKVLDRKISLLKINEKESSKRRNPHDDIFDANRQADELEKILQLFEKDGATEEPQSD
jgi:hypothetical protein